MASEERREAGAVQRPNPGIGLAAGVYSQYGRLSPYSIVRVYRGPVLGWESQVSTNPNARKPARFEEVKAVRLAVHFDGGEVEVRNSYPVPGQRRYFVFRWNRKQCGVAPDFGPFDKQELLDWASNRQVSKLK